MSLLSTLSVSELGLGMHYLAAVVMFATFFATHLLLCAYVRPWYKLAWLYRATLVLFGTLLFAFGIASASTTGRGFVNFQLAIIGFCIPLQMFASHVMALISPFEVSVVLAELVKGASKDTEVGSTPTSSEVAFPNDP
jgi:hypothetical protein